MAYLNAIIDLSHHNSQPDFATAKSQGILGVIHKATQGTHFVDPQYMGRRQAAIQAGLLWGAYHFGVGGDGGAQADWFLNAAKPGPTDLLVLDLENNPSGPSMTIAESEAFVQHVFDETGKWPGLYSGNFLKENISAGYTGVLVNCWLWVAQYASAPGIPSVWKEWTMWQYTDGAVGPEPRAVTGIGPCDRNMFNGDPGDLTRLWTGAP